MFSKRQYSPTMGSKESMSSTVAGWMLEVSVIR
jgi:hypothetical protein